MIPLNLLIKPLGDLFCDLFKIKSETNKEQIKKINEVATKLATGEMPPNTAKALTKFLSISLTNKKQIEQAMNTLCLELYPQMELSDSQKDTLFSALEKQYRPFRENIDALMWNKVIPLIPTNKISKQTVDYLNSITDENLQSIKEMFRYVANGQGIIYYNGIFENEMKPFWVESNSPKFYNDIWQGVRYGKSYPGQEMEFSKLPNLDRVTGAISFRNKLAIFMDVNQNNININIVCLMMLTEKGLELYNLLKNEIGTTPLDYIEKIIIDIQKDYPSVQMKIADIENFSNKIKFDNVEN